MITLLLALALNEAMGIVVFGIGTALIALGITIIIIREILVNLLRHLLSRLREKGEQWDFLQKLLEEIFAVIKDLPLPLRVAFLLIILGMILLVIGYSMAVGIWPLI